MPAVIEKVQTFVVSNPATLSYYSFTVKAGEGVRVRHTTRRTNDAYFLSLDNARQLWRRLVRSGYEQF
jgi:hypothetical protein